MKDKKKLIGFVISVGIVEALVVSIYQGYKKLKDVYHNLFCFKSEKMMYEDLFESDSSAACFSKINIDMLEAEFDSMPQTLEIFSAFSSIVIYVPENIEVFLDIDSSKSFFSSIDIAGEENKESAPLHLKCTALFSHIEVISAN